MKLFIGKAACTACHSIPDFSDDKFYIGGAASGYSGVKDPKLVPLNLSTAEEADLVELLKALTGEPIPTALRMDTSAP